MGCLHQYTVLALLSLGRYRKLLKFLRILITFAHFKDLNWITKSVYCINCLVVCKIILCSEFANIPDNAGRKTRRRRRTQAIAKCYAFHADAKSLLFATQCFDIWKNVGNNSGLVVCWKQFTTFTFSCKYFYFMPDSVFHVWVACTRLFLNFSNSG